MRRTPDSAGSSRAVPARPPRAHFKRDSGLGCYRRPVIFHQFLNDDLGCACYLVGDEEAGIAVVVDPPFAIDPILAEAAHRRVRIVRTVETHTHADHVSGHGRLALEHGVPVSIHAGAEVDYPHDPMQRRRRDRGRCGRAGRDPHPRPPARALLPHRDRPLARPESRGSCSPETRCSSATSPARTSRSVQPKAPKGSSTRSTGCSSSRTGSRSSPGTSQARCAASR